MGQREQRATSMLIELLLAYDDGDGLKSAAIVQKAHDELGADVLPLAMLLLLIESLKQIHGETGWREHLQLMRYEDEMGETDG